MTPVPTKLHSPVQSAEETEHDGTVCYLNAQRAIEECKSNAWVDIRKGSLGCKTSLIGEVDHSAGCAKIGERSGKSEVEVGLGDGAGNRSSNTELCNSFVS